jgi:uncharacterized GH25 family protein
MRILRNSLVGLAMCLPVVAKAHEFWISPPNYAIPAGGQVEADLRVGQNFEGPAYSYIPRQFTRFETIMNGVASPVEGVLGDRPALSRAADGEGLVIVVHETTDSTLTYSNWAKFEKFVAHKAFPTTLADHVARGITKKKFAERYRRYAKSLIAVGHGEGNDQDVGMKTEIIALANPYTDDMDALPVRVLLDGAPRAMVQIEMFERKPDGEVEITLHQTDAQGEARLPVKSGHEYLLDAVAMVPLENDDPENGPVWWSLWASLTFKMPD